MRTPAAPDRSDTGHPGDPGVSPEADSQLRDDREEIQADDRVLLIVADDANSASTLLDLVRENGFKGIVASSATQAFGLVKQFRPSAIALDLRLPDMDGLAALDLLKRDAEARHIPVIVIAAEDHLHRCRNMGAFRAVRKPAAREALGTALAETRKLLERKVKTLLVADRSKTNRTRITEAPARRRRSGHTVRDRQAGSRRAAKNPIRLHGAGARAARHDRGPTAEEDR